MTTLQKDKNQLLKRKVLVKQRINVLERAEKDVKQRLEQNRRQYDEANTRLTIEYDGLRKKLDESHADLEFTEQAINSAPF